MPCYNPEHTHHWPNTGLLIIERCERYCQFCTSPDDRKHRWKFAWFLRRHVEACHQNSGEYPGLIVDHGWTRPEKGTVMNNAPKTPKKKAPKRNSKPKGTDAVKVETQLSDGQSGSDNIAVATPAQLGSVTGHNQPYSIAAATPAQPGNVAGHYQPYSVDGTDFSNMANELQAYNSSPDNNNLAVAAGEGVDDMQP